MNFYRAESSYFFKEGKEKLPLQRQSEYFLNQRNPVTRLIYVSEDSKLYLSF